VEQEAKLRALVRDRRIDRQRVQLGDELQRGQPAGTDGD
jgi:hypothetical protein